MNTFVKKLLMHVVCMRFYKKQKLHFAWIGCGGNWLKCVTGCDWWRACEKSNTEKCKNSEQTL